MSSALVKTAGTNAGRLALYAYRRYGARFRAGVGARAYRAAMRYAKRAGKRYARRQGGKAAKRLKKIIDERVRKHNASANGKQDVQINLNTTMSRNTLYSFQLGSEIVRGDANNERIGSSLMYRAIRCEYSFQNKNTARNGSVLVRMMLIKQHDLTTDLGVDFFKDDITNTGKNFSQVSDTAMKLVHPINRNKIRILSQKTFKLYGQQNGTNSRYQVTGKFFYRFKKPLKMLYDTGIDATPNKPLYYIAWYMVDEDNTFTTGVAGDAQLRFHQYWSN